MIAIDSSPLIHLSKIGRLDILDDLIMSEMRIETGVYIRILREIEIIGW